MKTPKAIIAAGHKITATAAAEVIRAGGNAFDAALAAAFASCVAEPVLASLGGGGFMMASGNNKKPCLYDFFTHTPQTKPAETALDFYPIQADFGATTQEFHIGMGSTATPGMIKGIFDIHRDLCRLPMRTLIEPACDAARNGVTVNAFQHYISDVVSPILKSSPEALKLHESTIKPGTIADAGEQLFQQEMANAFEALAREGDALFYQGEMGRLLLDACRDQGGCLTSQDLTAYHTLKRNPLCFKYHGTTIFTNPPPAVGGTLIAFTLALLESEKLGSYSAGEIEHLGRIAYALKLTQQLRDEKGVDKNLDLETSQNILTDKHLQTYRQTMLQHPLFSRGTTQISVADSQGNFASMTLSNGEGSGFVLPECGIMLNNMLGEEDINPHGFHQWPLNKRVASMMSPSLAYTPDGSSIALGSGGSNRIRSAILQVLINLIDFKMDINSAVEHSRLHYDNNQLNLESGPSEDCINQLKATFHNHRVWPAKNLYFGGAHSVLRDSKGHLSGCGDSRRGGMCISV